jgi:crotonobetainyl-CoA:carnitine CoA-transferase CaiB-like acyl-CoA transferase
MRSSTLRKGDRVPPVLSELTVIELGSGEALAYCGRLLADAGARVIKIEPPEGDPARREGPRGPIEDPERSPLFLHLNTGKQSAILDLETSEGVDHLRGIAAHADVLLESLAPGTLEELGLGYDELKANNPRLVLASITPYGQTGPYRDFAATDLTLFATGGAMYREGLPGRAPMRYAGHVPRTFPGAVLAGMVAAAIFRRHTTNRGDWLDLSEVDCWASHPNQIARRLMHTFSGQTEEREDTRIASSIQAAGFGRGTYQCQDGYVTFLPLGDRHWPRLVELVERPELAADPRFATREARRDHRPDWEEIFTTYVAAHTMAELFTAAQRAGIPSAPLYDAPRILTDPHLEERDYLPTIAHSIVGALRYPGRVALAPEGFWATPAPAPLLGANTADLAPDHIERAADQLATLAATTTSDATEEGAATEDPASVDPTDPTEDIADIETPAPPPDPPQPDPPQPLPLAGIRAIEIAEIWAGPFCGAMLADLGAEVIKIEAIQRSARGAIRPLPGAPGYPNGDAGAEPWNRNAAFIAINRNKQGITLDLHSDEGQQILDQLLAEADLVFTNLSLDAQESLNLLPDRLHRANPNLVITLLTGFGLSGPYRYYRSMGMTLDAVSGHSVLRGYPDLDLSTITPVHHPDGISAATGLLISVLGLERRTQTNEGQVFDIAQLEGTIPHLGEYLLDWQLSDVPAPRLGNEHPWMSPHGVFQTNQDDSWVAVAIDTDEHFSGLASAIGRPDLVQRAEFNTVPSRHRHRTTLNRILAKWIGDRDRFEVQALLQARGVPAAAVLRPDVDHPTNEHLLARQALRDADFDGMGRFRYPNGPWHFTDSEPIPFEPPPHLGQHNHQVLSGLLGLSDDRIAALEENQVIGTHPLETADDPVTVRKH